MGVHPPPMGVAELMRSVPYKIFPRFSEIFIPGGNSIKHM